MVKITINICIEIRCYKEKVELKKNYFTNQRDNTGTSEPNVNQPNRKLLLLFFLLPRKKKHEIGILKKIGAYQSST